MGNTIVLSGMTCLKKSHYELTKDILMITRKLYEEQRRSCMTAQKLKEIILKENTHEALGER